MPYGIEEQATKNTASKARLKDTDTKSKGKISTRRHFLSKQKTYVRVSGHAYEQYQKENDNDKCPEKKRENDNNDNISCREKNDNNDNGNCRDRE